MLFNIKNWTKNTVAWFYALLISMGIVLFSILLHLFNIYETAGLRIVFILILLTGLIIMIRTYSKQHPSTTFIDAFLLCARTGARTIAILVPIILIYLSLNSNEVSIIQANETFGSPDTIWEIAGSTVIEIVAGTVVAGICASFLAGIYKKQN